MFINISVCKPYKYFNSYDLHILLSWLVFGHSDETILIWFIVQTKSSYKLSL